jgi:hypothetical protein
MTNIYDDKGARVKNGDKEVGNVKVEKVRVRLGGEKPLDGLSAKLSTEGTYEEEIQSLYCDSKRVIRCNTAFCLGLRDFPPLMAWITPWLSDLMRKWELVWPL